MNHAKLLTKLREIAKSVDEAIEYIDHDITKEVSEGFQVGTCQACGEPIFSHEKKTRGVHRQCYNYLNNRFVRTKQKTWQDLEQEGLVGPPGKSGRKGRRDP